MSAKIDPIGGAPVRAEPSCIKPIFDLAAVRVRQSAFDTRATLSQHDEVIQYGATISTTRMLLRFLYIQ